MNERLRLSITFNHPPYPNKPVSLPIKTLEETIKEVLAERDKKIALGIMPNEEIDVIGSCEYKFKVLSRSNFKPCDFHADFIKAIDYFKFPKIYLDSVNSFNAFPESRGIYFCTRNSEVWYVGKANNFRSRWRNHHKLEALKTIKDVVIYFQEIDKFSSEEIHKAEQEYIEMLQPVFNNTSNPEKYLRIAL
jgi:hypothetical protein